MFYAMLHIKWRVLKKTVKNSLKISGYMYEFQDLTPISGHFRTNFKISRQHPGLRHGHGHGQAQPVLNAEITAAARGGERKLDKK